MSEVVELGLLADPEDAVGHDAHGIDDQAGGEYDEGVLEIALRVYGFDGGDAEIEHEQGHGDGEDAVAEGGEAFDALSGNTVVEGVHRKESNGSRGSGQNSGTMQRGELRTG